MRNHGPHSFRGTYDYYIEFRPRIPEKVINIIIQYFDLCPTDRILDIGCGTGQVALAMDGRCKEITCLDPDPEMIVRAKEMTKDSKTKLTWINKRAEELSEIKEKLGSFKLATSSRAFHRVNQDQVLKTLDSLIEQEGGISLFSDRTIWQGQEDWQGELEKIVKRYSKDEKLSNGNQKPNGSWEDSLSRSKFNYVITRQVSITRSWSIEGIIGYVFSTSFANPYVVGNKLNQFKKEIKDKLLSTNPEGKFQEKAVWSIVLGSRRPLTDFYDNKEDLPPSKNFIPSEVKSSDPGSFKEN